MAMRAKSDLIFGELCNNTLQGNLLQIRFLQWCCFIQQDSPWRWAAITKQKLHYLTKLWDIKSHNKTLCRIFIVVFLYKRKLRERKHCFSKPNLIYFVIAIVNPSGPIQISVCINSNRFVHWCKQFVSNFVENKNIRGRSNPEQSLESFSKSVKKLSKKLLLAFE